MGSEDASWILALLSVFAVVVCQEDNSRPPAIHCDVHPCWSRYELALDYYQAEVPGVPDRALRQCVTLRTYRACLNDLYKQFTAACSGDLVFQTSRKFSENNLALNNCTDAGPVYPDGPPPPGGAGATEQPPCTFIGRPSYGLCSLFGDPHLHTFSDDFQTCKLVGAWPLIDNQFLTVQVSNELVADDSMATATTKLTVVIHAIREKSTCGAPEAMFYTAENGNLPSSFDDGSTETAGNHGSIALRVVSPGERVEIHLRYIDTRVIVHLAGAYLSVAIVMPERVINATARGRGGSEGALQLCHAGCPSKERIGFAQFFRAAAAASVEPSTTGAWRQVSRRLAVARCREAGVTDFYFDSCVFDLLKTGNFNFTAVAQTAFLEALRYRRSPSSPLLANRTDLTVYEARSRWQATASNAACNPWLSSSSSSAPSALHLAVLLTIFELFV